MLYKFRSFDQLGYWRKSLEQRALWCSKRDAFNDPFELHHQIDRHPADIEAVFEYWLEVYPHWRGQLARHAVPVMAASMVTDELDSVGICCFSDMAENTQLWSYYANSHTGFCLGFEFPEAADEEHISNSRIFKVEYSTECPVFPISVYGQRPYDIYPHIDRILTTKHKNWEHERECRYVHSKANALASFHPESLREVVFGSRISSLDREALVAECTAINPEVHLREVVVVPRTYELGIRDA